MDTVDDVLQEPTHNPAPIILSLALATRFVNSVYVPDASDIGHDGGRVAAMAQGRATEGTGASAPAARSEPRDLPALTGLRGAFALWVVVFHTLGGLELQGVPVEALLSQPLSRFLFSGALAVEGFFILSGFILSFAYAAVFVPLVPLSRRWAHVSGRFLWARLARIYPVHIAVTAAFVGLYFAGFKWVVAICGNPLNRPPECSRFTAEGLSDQVLLISAWGVDPTVHWNFVAWSISAEWFAYLWFPLLVVAASRVPPKVALATALALLAVTSPLQAQWGRQFHGIADTYSILRVIPTFISGCLLYTFYRSPTFEMTPWPFVALASMVAVAALTMSQVVPMESVVFLALLILSLASRQRGVIHRLLSARPLRWLGKISYSLYMTHFLTLELIQSAMLEFKLQQNYKYGSRVLVACVGSVLVTCLVAAVVFRLIEQPAREVMGGRSAKTREPAPIR